VCAVLDPAPQDGSVPDRAKFRASFAADVSPETAAFMADSQVPWGVAALDGAITEPRGIEAQLVPRHDRRPDDSARCQRPVAKRAGATVVEVKGSHSVFVSQPKP